MRMVSLLLSVRPERLTALAHELPGIPGVQVHPMPSDCRMVVTIGDVDGQDVMPSISAVHALPGVLSTTLTYEYSDEQPELPEDRS